MKNPLTKCWEIKQNTLITYEGLYQNWLKIAGKTYLGHLKELAEEYPNLLVDDFWNRKRPIKEVIKELENF